MSQAALKALAEKRNTIWAGMTALNDTALEAQRELTADEQRQWEEGTADLDRFDDRITDLRDLMSRAAASQAAVTDLLGPDAEGAGHRGNDALAEQLREFFRGERKAIDITPSAPVNYRELSHRALLKSPDSAGGYTVKQGFYDKLIEHAIESSGVLKLGPTVLTTSNGELIPVPVTTSYSTSTQTAEGGAIAESDPVFGQRLLGAYKYPVLNKISSELSVDSAFDIEDFIARQAGRAVGDAFGAKLAVGTGTNEPSGVLTGATLGVTGANAVAGVPTYDNLIDLQFSVIDPYASAPNAGWLMRRNTLGRVRKLKDGDNSYIFAPATGVNDFDTLLGQKVTTDPNIPATAALAKSILFGDFEAYIVRQVQSIRFERSDDFAFGTDMITYRTIVRGDGVLGDQTGAIKYFAGGAAV